MLAMMQPGMWNCLILDSRNFKRNQPILKWLVRYVIWHQKMDWNKDVTSNRKLRVCLRACFTYVAHSGIFYLATVFSFSLLASIVKSGCLSNLLCSIVIFIPFLCCCCWHYSDVYSFGILLWELCTLKKPFSQLKTIEAFRETVFKGNHRPNVKEIVSRHGQGLATLIQ